MNNKYKGITFAYNCNTLTNLYSFRRTNRLRRYLFQKKECECMARCKDTDEDIEHTHKGQQYANGLKLNTHKKYVCLCVHANCFKIQRKAIKNMQEHKISPVVYL